jgi:hypothetical protein
MNKRLWKVLFLVVITGSFPACGGEVYGVSGIVEESCKRSCIGRSHSGCPHAEVEEGNCMVVCVGLVSEVSEYCQQKISEYTYCQGRVGYACNRFGYTIDANPSVCNTEREQALNCQSHTEPETKDPW